MLSPARNGARGSSVSQPLGKRWQTGRHRRRRKGKNLVRRGRRFESVRGLRAFPAKPRGDRRRAKLAQPLPNAARVGDSTGPRSRRSCSSARSSASVAACSGAKPPRCTRRESRPPARYLYAHPARFLRAPRAETPARLRYRRHVQTVVGDGSRLGRALIRCGAQRALDVLDSRERRGSRESRETQLRALKNVREGADVTLKR